MHLADLENLRSSGIEIVDPFLDREQTAELVRLVDPLIPSCTKRSPGIRRVLLREPRICELLRDSPLPELIEAIGGSNCRVVRALLFDKSEESNWMVPWHQDATIALAERVETRGYTLWAIKDGEHHCRPPLDVLESLFTVRIHIDACGATSGPLRVVSESHRLGLLDDGQLARIVERGNIIVATVGAGGAVLTTPLSVHSSERSSDPARRRRVLHLDCTAFQLPGGLRWAESWHPRAAVTPSAPLSSRTSTAP